MKTERIALAISLTISILLASFILYVWGVNTIQNFKQNIAQSQLEQTLGYISKLQEKCESLKITIPDGKDKTKEIEFTPVCKK